MKKIAVYYWISTLLIFLFQGVMPAFTSQTAMAKESISHLGYPEYFGVMLAVFKVAVLMLSYVSYHRINPVLRSTVHS